MALIPIGFQIGMEIENIETEKTLDSRSLQKVLRVLLASSSCFLQGCERTFLTGGDITWMDYLTVKNMVMTALTLLIAYLIYAIRLQQVQLRFSQNVFDELTRRLRPDRRLRRQEIILTVLHPRHQLRRRADLLHQASLQIDQEDRDQE